MSTPDKKIESQIKAVAKTIKLKESQGKDTSFEKDLLKSWSHYEGWESAKEYLSNNVQSKSGRLNKKQVSSSIKRKKGLAKNTKSGFRAWVKKVDSIFSKYIRLRDSVKGRCKCITCGESHDIREVDAGHYRPRQHMSTRYDEKNVHAQCKRCNNFEGGEQHKHGIKIDELYGKGTAAKLEAKSKEQKKYTIPELQDLYKHYEKKVTKLKGG